MSRTADCSEFALLRNDRSDSDAPIRSPFRCCISAAVAPGGQREQQRADLVVQVARKLGALLVGQPLELRRQPPVLRRRASQRRLHAVERGGEMGDFRRPGLGDRVASPPLFEALQRRGQRAQPSQADGGGREAEHGRQQRRQQQQPDQPLRLAPAFGDLVARHRHQPQHRPMRPELDRREDRRRQGGEPGRRHLLRQQRLGMLQGNPALDQLGPEMAAAVEPGNQAIQGGAVGRRAEILQRRRRRLRAGPQRRRQFGPHHVGGLHGGDPGPGQEAREQGRRHSREQTLPQGHEIATMPGGMTCQARAAGHPAVREEFPASLGKSPIALVSQ
nr:hypothetical protein [uncultured Lichenicoccus sp.]